MLQHLDRKGEGSKYSFTNDEGETVKARRRKGQWEMEVVKESENNTIISMPWGMAECMLGREVPAYTGKDEVRVQDRAGRRRPHPHRVTVARHVATSCTLSRCLWIVGERLDLSREGARPSPTSLEQGHLQDHSRGALP